jgi:NAD-dependent SIR2 family protein deacetylase|tara:strand:+ start:11277 stop:12308 length:1032 start_codon:yes stop_codon:yes gene_type:complete
MKFIILSGAGLSAPSGLPLYSALKSSSDYAEFFGNDEAKALEIALSFSRSYGMAKPNAAHTECFRIQEFCKALNIDFTHYTLNVDDLSEQAGNVVTHLYGCIDNLEDLVARRNDVASIDLGEISWEKGDVLIVLGVSNTGYPLAYLESRVLAGGATMLNYNIEVNSELSCQKFTGSVDEELKGALALSYLDLVFDEYPFGSYVADDIRFSLYGRSYTAFFSPTKEHKLFQDELNMIEQATGELVTDSTSEVKFDLVANIKSENSFQMPDDNFNVRELSTLGFIIVTLICAHSRMKKVDMYTATAIEPNLVPYYNRLAKKYAKQLNYREWCAFGPEGDNYVFKK